MRAVVAGLFEIYIICLLFPFAEPQRKASSIFASGIFNANQEQVVLWSGNNAILHAQPASAYQFSYTFSNQPANLSQAYAIFNGFDFLNQNRVSFSVHVILNPTSGTFTIYFTPLSTLAFYSVSFNIVAVPLSAISMISIGRYCKLHYN